MPNVRLVTSREPEWLGDVVAVAGEDCKWEQEGGEPVGSGG